MGWKFLKPPGLVTPCRLKAGLHTRTRRIEAATVNHTAAARVLGFNARKVRGILPGARTFVASGFTLIELMVVIIVIGIVSAVIIPAMKGTFEEALLHSSSRELVTVCDLAYSRAISANQVHRVRIDIKTGRYVVEKPGKASGAKDEFEPLKNVAGGEGKLDERITIRIETPPPAESDENSPDQEAPPAPGDDKTAPGSEDAITFFPDGTADAKEVVLQDRAGFRVGLRVNPVTSRVDIVELERK